MRFVWNDDYSVNVKIFDEQHKHFFELANACYDLLIDGASDRTKVETAVGEMADYALYHLSAEEEAFKKYNYPRMVEHVLAHEAYRQKMGELFEKSRKVEGGELSKLISEVVDFATNWLFSHILLMDKQYAEFFEGKI